MCVCEININSLTILSPLSNKNPRDRVTSVRERKTEREGVERQWGRPGNGEDKRDRLIERQTTTEKDDERLATDI